MPAMGIWHNVECQQLHGLHMVNAGTLLVHGELLNLKV
jgi:hypothetical protein